MSTNITPDDDLLTCDEAARFLSKPKGTLSQWRYRGLGPTYYKFGNSVRYRVGDLREFIDSHRIEPRKPVPHM